jgi:hypothetical protein
MTEDIDAAFDFDDEAVQAVTREDEDDDAVG